MIHQSDLVYHRIWRPYTIYQLDCIVTRKVLYSLSQIAEVKKWVTRYVGWFCLIRIIINIHHSPVGACDASYFGIRCAIYWLCFTLDVLEVMMSSAMKSIVIALQLIAKSIVFGLFNLKRCYLPYARAIKRFWSYVLSDVLVM